MHHFENKKNEKIYTDLIDEIKMLNSQWLDIRNSKDYKIGMVLNKTKDSIKRLKIKEYKKIFSSWLNGYKSRKIKAKKITNQQSNQNNKNYFSDEKIAIYTSVYGNYDNILEPYFIPNNCDFYIFTDQAIDEKKSIWKKRNVDFPENFTNVEKNRYVKMNPHKIFNEYKYSIYVDGNVQIISDLTEYIYSLNEIGIGVHNHNLRDCVYDELKAVKKLKKIKPENAKKHEEYLKNNNMPKNYGLLQCNIIVREHHNEVCKKIMNEWWEEFLKFPYRDQISLPYVLYKNNISTNKISTLGNNVYNNPSFRVILHK